MITVRATLARTRWRTIKLPAGLTSIGDQGFYGCSSLATIELPASLTSIGEQMFDGCSSLATIELPAVLTYIGVNDI
tara:strand:- start:656 stop:886 length:231 start_codon:yes stop_codon:yes gene_type:complete